MSAIGVVVSNLFNLVFERRPVDVEVLVVNWKLLGYDLLFEVDIIKRLGGDYVTSSCSVSFHQLDRHLCTAITINESYFHAESDLSMKIWFVPRKWFGDQTPPMKNQMPEYPATKQLREKHSRTANLDR